jgi:anti-anti-sigma factor
MEERPASGAKIESSIIEGFPKTAIVKLEGYIQTREARTLQQVLSGVDEEGVKRVILDMRGVTYVSSATVGLLAMYSNKRKTEEGCDAVAMVGLPKSTRNVLETLGLLKMFLLFDDIDTALNSFSVTTRKSSDQ